MPWEFFEITVGTGIIPPLTWPDARPDDYDPDLYWDEDNGVWSIPVITVAGGGRYQSQLVVIGQDDTGNGVIYYGEI